MAQLTQRDLHTPHNAANIRKIRARMEAIRSRQTAAATLTETYSLDVAGAVREITFLANAVPAAGESLTIDVQRNGVSVLAAAFVYNNTRTARTLYNLTLAANANIAMGDQLTVIRTYVAGGGPTPIGSSVVAVEIA